jgi:alanine racemase
LSLEELYDKVSHLIKVNNIDRVIIIGETISKFKDKFTNALLQNYSRVYRRYSTTRFYETILIKGARAFQFEEIVYLLKRNT